jgi:hypothetical protein
MYLRNDQWPDQNPILFRCRRNRRSNHVVPPRLPQHMLKLSLLTLFLLIELLTYILRLLTMPLLLTTLLLLFIVGSLKSDRTLLITCTP